MTKIFTPNDVLRFIYKETSEEESEAIHNAMLMDNNLLDDYYELLRVKESIDVVEISPPTELINNILAYSKNTKLTPISEQF